MGRWENLALKLLEEFDGITDELAIRKACIDLMTEQIINQGLTLKTPLRLLRKPIKEKYPEVKPSKAKPDAYYFTDAGRGRVERFEHLALWYLTENTDRWDVIGDDARREYWKGLPKFDDEETSENPTEKVTQKPVTATKPDQPKLTTEVLETAVIDALELDEESKEILELALNHSGLDLAEFMQRAIKTYANTITGKIRRLEEDSLENISTEELLSNPKYSTYPGRAEEMVRRAINAIKIYNSEVATEPKQRWIITQSLLSELTGSRGSVVQSAMQKYRDDIDSHHKKYPEFFNEDGTLKQYFNRKRGVDIRDEIDLVKLVPNG